MDGSQLGDHLRPRYVDALTYINIVCTSTGYLHSSTMLEDGNVYTWGDGFFGHLVLGDKRPKLLLQQVKGEGGIEDECVYIVI